MNGRCCCSCLHTRGIEGRRSYQSRNVGAGDQFRAPPDPPADKTVTTIFVGGVDEQVTEQDILYIYIKWSISLFSNLLLISRREFGKFGSVSTVRVLAFCSCAFVEMVERAAAEKAMKALWGKLTIHQTRLRINWAKPRGRQHSLHQLLSTWSHIGQIVELHQCYDRIRHEVFGCASATCRS